MYGNFEHDPAPIDSYDLYAMGLRAARCNGCKYAQLKHELGDKFLPLHESRGEAFPRWVTVYELDAQPESGQGEPQEHEGRPIRFRVGFASIEHSDECYNWRPPSKRRELERPSRSSLRHRIAALLKGRRR